MNGAVPTIQTPAGVMKLEPYEYKGLARSTFRLLRLRPANTEHADVDCEIIEVQQPYPGDRRKPFYEALSWCWGKGAMNQHIRIHEAGGKVSSFPVSQTLKSALRAIRQSDRTRDLWVDAICINQAKIEERNQQVPRMDLIYSKAKSICIWLGEGDESSRDAIRFIKEQVLQFWEFDKLIEDTNMSGMWAVLLMLMKRPWFSRRWVVQEIALSPRGGTIYCGSDSISWQDFADAVSLFVEVETATHRLSDVMRTNQLFGHIPDFFGDVQSLGAALLVNATSNLFRGNSKSSEKTAVSTLEYLVSRLSVFESSQPRDTIYALLAISKDTTPQNFEQEQAAASALKSHKKVIMEGFTPKQGFSNQPYNVDYNLSVLDVFQEFVEYCIRKAEPQRALDIICRPWAPMVLKRHDDPLFKNNPSKAREEFKDDDLKEMKLPTWIPSVSGAAHEMEEHPIVGLRMERQNADSLVGLPGVGESYYSAAGTSNIDLKKLDFIKWPEWLPENVRTGENTPAVDDTEANGTDANGSAVNGDEGQGSEEMDNQEQGAEDSTAEGDSEEQITEIQMSEQQNSSQQDLNSDVQQENSTSGAQTNEEDSEQEIDEDAEPEEDRFECYPDYSMFVEGFILDEVETVGQIASNGNIPFQWLNIGNWRDVTKNPPEDFWRTLVADRATGGRNPPTYFPRACRESMKFKARTRSRVRGTLDCKKLINEGRCTIVAEFLRRVQDVIWNRCLMKTKGHKGKPGHLGIVRDDVKPGFKVCILYGCSVPVILQECSKTPEEIERERPALYAKFCEKRNHLARKILARRRRRLDGAPGASNAPSPTTMPPQMRKRANSARSESPTRNGTSSVNGEERQTWRDEMRNWSTTLQLSPINEERERRKREGARLIKEEERNFRVPEKYYRLFGECYMHGMMNGDAIKVKNDNTLKIRNMLFEIR